MDIKQIKELIALFEKSGLHKINIKEKGVEITLEKGGPHHDHPPHHHKPHHHPIPHAPPPPPPPPPLAHAHAGPEHKESPQKPEQEIDPNAHIKSPMVGTFYMKPTPDDPPFVKVGDLINAGDTICIIEAMKVMNEVKSDKQGRVVEILVEDGSPVEYGQPLFIIE